MLRIDDVKLYLTVVDIVLRRLQAAIDAIVHVQCSRSALTLLNLLVSLTIINTVCGC